MNNQNEHEDIQDVGESSFIPAPEVDGTNFFAKLASSPILTKAELDDFADKANNPYHDHPIFLAAQELNRVVNDHILTKLIQLASEKSAICSARQAIMLHGIEYDVDKAGVNEYSQKIMRKNIYDRLMAQLEATLVPSQTLKDALLAYDKTSIMLDFNRTFIQSLIDAGRKLQPAYLDPETWMVSYTLTEDNAGQQIPDELADDAVNAFNNNQEFYKISEAASAYCVDTMGLLHYNKDLDSITSPGMNASDVEIAVPSNLRYTALSCLINHHGGTISSIPDFEGLEQFKLWISLIS